MDRDRDRWTEIETDGQRQSERDRDRDRWTETEREGQRQNKHTG